MKFANYFFRPLAALIGIGLLAMVFLNKSAIEPSWLFVLGKIVAAVVALFFLDVAITGGLGIFALAVFLNNRDGAGRYKYVGYVLGIGAFVVLVIVNDKTVALRPETPEFRLAESLFYIGAYIIASAIFYLLFWGKK